MTNVTHLSKNKQIVILLIKANYVNPKTSFETARIGVFVRNSDNLHEIIHSNFKKQIFKDVPFFFRVFREGEFQGGAVDRMGIDHCVPRVALMRLYNSPVKRK